jgi:hypothetical protein
MGAKTFLLGSLVLNAALAAALIWPRHKEAISPGPPIVQSELGSEPLPTEKRTPPAVSASKPFHWTDLESSDFRQYMTNLRRIGCPEETIRDLVVAEVNKLYAPKFAMLTRQGQHYDYWKPASKKPREDLARQLEALRSEKRTLLKTLLGIESDPHEQWANISVDQLIEQGRFAFLSDEKQKQVREILARYDLNQDSDPRLVREQRRQELAQVLSPEELYAFDLRDSNAADSIRNRFGDADLSEAEYKKLFDLRKAYEEAVGAVADNSDPEKMRKRSEARKALDEAYKEAVGEERMTEITRQQDPGWRALTQVGQQFNLDQPTLDRAYAYQQAAAEQLSRIFSDANLPRDERRRLVDEVNAQLLQNMTGVLGDAPSAELRKTGPAITFSTGGDSFAISTMPRGPISGPGATSIMIQRPAK